MKVISLNVNGLKSAIAKGLFAWLESEQAEVVCLQNTYLSADEFAQNCYQLPNYFGYASSAPNSEIGGSVIYCKIPPKAIITNLGLNVAFNEGRFIQADFDKISVVSISLPFGKDSFELNLKFKLMDELLAYFAKQIRKRRDYIYCSSMHVAHKKIDVHDSSLCKKEPGFMPAESIWLDEIISGIGYIDVLRKITREGKQFSYWDSERSFALNLGMRFDYQLVTKGLRYMITEVNYAKNQQFSDHAPVIVNYNWDLTS